MRKGLIILGILGALIAVLGSFGTLLGGFGGFAVGDLAKDAAQAKKGTGVFATGLLSFGVALFSLVACIIGGVSKRTSTALSFSLLVLVLGAVSVYLYNWISGSIIFISGVMGLLGAKDAEIKDTPNTHKSFSFYFVVLTIIVACGLSFAFKNAASIVNSNKPVEPAAAPVTKPSVKPEKIAPTLPTQSQIAQALYKKYTVRSSDMMLILSNGQEANAYYETPITIGNTAGYIAFMYRNSPKNSSYADGSSLDSVLFLEKNNQWSVSHVAYNLKEVGSYGAANPLSKEEKQKVQIHAVGKNTTGIFLPNYESHQGYGMGSLSLISVQPDLIKPAGHFSISEENSGACSDESDESEIKSPCYEWNGTIQVKPYTGDTADSIQVIKSGTERVNDTLVKPANTTYVKNAQGIYEEVK